MIKLFNTTDNLFQTNGDKIIIPTRAVIHKEDNGPFFLDLETNLEYVEDLTPNKILVANTPQGSQAFRIKNVNKTRKKITLQAYHIYYDTQNYAIEDSYVVEKNCNQALEHLNAATDTTSPFTTTSNITHIDSYRCVRKSLYEAIEVVLERWGGHLVRDNFEIKIMNSIGADNEVTVRYGKNMKNIQATYNWDLVVTKLLPVGKDGLMLPETYLYSTNQYDIPYTKVVTFDQNEIDPEDYKVDGEIDENAYTQALIEDLREKGAAYLETNSIPSVNYTLEANLERITDIGDTIEVIDERLGINILTNLIAFDYNCILEKYTTVQFGNFTPKLANLTKMIAEETQTAIQENNGAIQITLNQELQAATDRIMGVLGSSYVIYDGDKILIVDSLPKETAINCIMINSGGIGFSNTGINGPFTSAWTIDNVLNMENINVINLTADLIKGGTLKLGSNLNQYGELEIYNEENTLIAIMNKDGLRMNGADGSYILINNTVGFAGYDRNNEKIYWAAGDAFHMKKSEVEEEITLGGKLRYIPVTRYEDVPGSNLFDYDDRITAQITTDRVKIRSDYKFTFLIECEANTTYRISKTIDTGTFKAVATWRDAQEIRDKYDYVIAESGRSSEFGVSNVIDGSGVNSFELTTGASDQTILVYLNSFSSTQSTGVTVQKLTRTLINDGIGLVSVIGGGN